MQTKWTIVQFPLRRLEGVLRPLSDDRKLRLKTLVKDVDYARPDTCVTSGVNTPQVSYIALILYIIFQEWCALCVHVALLINIEIRWWFTRKL